MFAYRRQLPRVIGRSAYFARPRILPKPHHLSRQSYAYKSTNQGQHEAPRSKKMSFTDKFLVYVFLSGTAQLLILFAYEPLRDYGLFDNIATWTIFLVVPPKRVKPEKAATETLYQPITRDKEIRLLVLEPGAPDDELKCHLVNAELSWRTRYEALSYTWGDPAITRQLSCSGRTIDVTVSLHDALTDLRDPTRSRLLWVDAVCINQANNDEKAKQIQLMGDIYSQARRVLIYLGKTDPSVNEAMESIRRLDWDFMPIHVRRYCSRLLVLGPVGVELLDYLPKMKPITDDKINWDPIINLLQRPWFQRTWIIQEAILAKRARVFCGDESIPWAMLERVVIAMNSYKGEVGKIPGYPSIVDAVASVHLMRSARRDRYTSIMLPYEWLHRKLFFGSRMHRQEFTKLLDLIMDSRKFACSNPQDKVFGMLGVTGQDIRSEYLTPNYSISPGDVFRKFVLWEIFHNGSLRVLGSSSDKAGSQNSSPSWVPDFNRLDPHQSLTRYENRASFSASGDLPIEAHTSNNDTVLHLKGRIVDTLHTVGQEMIRNPADLEDKGDYANKGMTWYDGLRVNKNMIIEATLIWLEAMVRLSQGGRHPVPRANAILETQLVDGKLVLKDGVPSDWVPFLRALVYNRTDHGQEATKEFEPMIAAYVRLSFAADKLPRSYVRKHYPLARRAIEASLTVAQSRRFAGTNMGMVGYVPMRAKKGDLVVIFYGADVPFVVRRETGGKYSLVGECFMNGIMYDGLAMRIDEIKDEDVDFALV
ncbi:HET domain-containing protein [Fusarium sp. LHS14.1]|nr:HET domain-containing protein [Fusarium sp. LHS14.1]